MKTIVLPLLLLVSGVLPAAAAPTRIASNAAVKGVIVRELNRIHGRLGWVAELDRDDRVHAIWPNLRALRVTTKDGRWLKVYASVTTNGGRERIHIRSVHADQPLPGASPRALGVRWVRPTREGGVELPASQLIQ